MMFLCAQKSVSETHGQHQHREVRQKLQGLSIVSGKYSGDEDRTIQSDQVSFTIPRRLLTELSPSLHVCDIQYILKLIMLHTI